MTAKEMFEELGYKKENYEFDKETISLRKESGVVSDYKGVGRLIIFHTNKSSYINDYKKHDGKITDYCFGSPHLNLKEIRAINKQVEELGWIDEN